MENMNRWPHQLLGVSEVLAAIARGQRRIILQAVTGSGKTVIMQDLAMNYLGRKLNVLLLTNRKLLIEQTSAVMEKAGVPHGIISPDHDADMTKPFQIGSSQTIHSRVMKRRTEKLYDADLVLVDEVHLQCGDTTMAILEAHHAAGAAVVGFTATPIDLGNWFETLVCACSSSEGRACGALLLATHYASSEPDYRQFKKLRESADKIEVKEVVKAFSVPGIFGIVLNEYRRLNPQQRPTILFGPDVAGSLYFAEQFHQAGIEAVHIDGDDVWAHGRLYRSNQEVRASVIQAVRDGRVKVVCNRFVLREGLDLPELGHCILATVFGSLSSYLQSIGRLLRNHHSLAGVTIQDHGGHWWRFGSPNADRQWHLGASNSMMLGLHADRMRDLSSEKKPSCCPQCKAVQIWKGPVCQFCGWKAEPGRKVSRPVVQSDGTLREMVGDVFRPHRISRAPNGPARWKQMYFRSMQPKAKGRTFRAACALFAMENNWGYPDPRWPFMPRAEMDFYRAIRDVPEDQLIQEEEWDHGHGAA